MSRSLVSFVPARTRFPLGRVMVTEKACQLDPAVLTESLHHQARGGFGPIHDCRTYNTRALRQGRIDA